MAKAEKSKVYTPKFRVSFPWVFKPQPAMAGSDPNNSLKYSTVMLFDGAAQKEQGFLDMRRIAKEAFAAKFGAKTDAMFADAVLDGKAWPDGYKCPFRNGMEKADMDGYGKGVVFVKASSSQKPGLLDRAAQPITDESLFYAGCYAKATVVAYGYDRAGNRGVAFGLNNIQKVGEGQAFSGRESAESEFKAEEGPDPFA